MSWKKKSKHITTFVKLAVDETYFGVNFPKKLHCIVMFDIICPADTAVWYKQK